MLRRISSRVPEVVPQILPYSYLRVRCREPYPVRHSLQGEGGRSWLQRRCYRAPQELAEGKSLAALVDGGWRGSEDDVKGIAVQLLETLRYLASRRPPITHRCCSNSPSMHLSRNAQDAHLAAQLRRVSVFEHAEPLPPSPPPPPSCRDLAWSQCFL